MPISNEVFDDMTRTEASNFVENNFDAFENIYYSELPPSGVSGKVWRYFWGSPRRTSPILYYMSFKISELYREQSDTIKQERKIAREKERKKLRNHIESLNEEKTQLESELKLSFDNIKELDIMLSDKERKNSFLASELSQLEEVVASSENILRMKAYLKDINMLVQRLVKHEYLDLNDLASYRLRYKLESMDYERLNKDE